MAANCSSVYVDGTETAGASATVSVQSGSLSAALSLVVWYPATFRLTASRSTLSRVTDLRDGACRQAYQSATLLAAADFGCGGSCPAFSSDVTHLAAMSIRSSAGAVANVSVVWDRPGGSPIGVQVVGKARGSAIVQLVLFGRVRAAAIVAVSDTPVAVTALAVSAVADLSVSSAPMAGGVAATAVVGRTQRAIGGQIGFVAGLIFSDTSADDVSAASLAGLQLSSLNATVLTLDGAVAVARGSGQGALVSASLAAPGCHPRTIASSAAVVAVQLPVIDEVLVSNSAAVVAVHADLAATIDLPLQARFTVRIRSGAALSDAVADTRLQVQAPPELSVSRNASVLVVTASVSGTFQIGLSFLESSLTAQVTVTAVGLVGGNVTFFSVLADTESDWKGLDALGAVASGLFQPAAAVAILQLSSGDVVRLTPAPSAVMAAGAVLEELNDLLVVTPLAAGMVTLTLSLAGQTLSGSISVSNSVAAVQQVQLYLPGTVRASPVWPYSPQFNILFDNCAGLHVVAGSIYYTALLRVRSNSPALVVLADGRLAVQRDAASVLVEVVSVAGDTLYVAQPVAARLSVPVGSVDVGAEVGPAVAAAAVGSTVTVPIFINTGDNDADAVEIMVVYFLLVQPFQ